jgi:hypothetical protein
MGPKGRKSTNSRGTPAKLHERGCRSDKVTSSQPSISNLTGPNTENRPLTQADFDSELLTVSLLYLDEARLTYIVD